MGSSEKEDEVNRLAKQEILNNMETEKQPCNSMHEYGGGGQADMNEKNETLDNERN
jgi:hypothetical protein